MALGTFGWQLAVKIMAGRLRGWQWVRAASLWIARTGSADEKAQWTAWLATNDYEEWAAWMVNGGDQPHQS